MKILWLYGSVPKFDVINHWYHTGFARVISQMPNVDLMIYGKGMKKLNPDLAKIHFDIKMTGKDIKKEFNFDVIIMDNKNRFVYSQTFSERRGKKIRIYWLKPEFFNGLNNIPKVFLEGDYHQHFEAWFAKEEKGWYADRKIDLLLVRHLSALNYHENKTIPIKWFPCSVNTDIFKPNNNVQRKNKLCLISGYGITYYPYRNTAGKILEPVKLIDIYSERFIGDDYIKNLQSYICHLSGSSIRAITPAKMFEIMASGSLMLTDAGWEYGLKELFPNDSYCTYNKEDYSDVITKAKKIINEPAFREYTTTKALKCVREKHTHEVRGKELIDIIVDSFRITYDDGTPKNIFGRIGQFFKQEHTNGDSIPIITNTIKSVEGVKIVEEIKVPEIQPILSVPNPHFENKLVASKNEEKIVKLNLKNIEICVLKQTCYNILFNNRVGDTLDIVVRKSDKSKRILGESFESLFKPKETRKFIYKNIEIYIPYPILPYLKSVYGDGVVEKFKEKKKRLRLLNDRYKFSNR